MHKPSDIDTRKAALARLGVATKERVGPEVQHVYLDDCKNFSTEAFVRACRHLEHSLQWFPKVSELREACAFQDQRLREARDQRRPKLADGDTPVDPAKWGEFRSRVDALVKRKGM